MAWRLGIRGHFIWRICSPQIGQEDVRVCQGAAYAHHGDASPDVGFGPKLSLFDLLFNLSLIQGDTSGRTKPPVEIKTKAVF